MSGGHLNNPKAFTIGLKHSGLLWQCQAGETLLESAQRQGICLPHSCQNGTCRTCRLQSHVNSFNYRVEWPGLSAEEKRSGMTLSCVAIPNEDVWIDDSGLDTEQFTQAFHVIHEDPYFLILHKPSGLLSVPGRGPDKQDCLSARVQKRYPNALVVHRLDQATSGVMVMALGAQAQRELSLLFSKAQMHKTYLAKVHGHVPNSHWQVIDEPIYANWDMRPKREVNESGKPSQTRYRCILSNAKLSVLEIEPLTGRTHQIRVHLSHLGHPILGDTLYASEEVAALSPRLMLHAHTLSFLHPFSNVPMSVCAAPADEFKAL